MFMKSRADEIRDELGELTARINAAEALRVELLAELDDQGGWGGVGIRSIGHWASIALGLMPRHTNALLACGKALRDLPGIGAALATGELTVDKVTAVARVATPATEAKWLHIARTASATQVARVAARYATVCRQQDDDPAAPRRDPTMSVAGEDDGMVRLVALLEPDDAAIVRAAIEAEMERAWRDGNHRDEAASVRAARALVTIAEAALATGPRPLDGSDRTTVVLHVDADYLAGARPDGRCHLADGSRIEAGTARRLACDATLIALTERDGNPIDVGRARRVVSRAQRRALDARDGGCSFPGCGATRFLDAHHIDHWIDGGPTDLANLVLLCRHHHRLHHEGGYRIERDRHDGTLRWLTPTGQDVRPKLRPVTARPTALRDRQRAAGFWPTWLTPHAKDPLSSTASETLDGLLRQRPPPDRPAA